MGLLFCMSIVDVVVAGENSRIQNNLEICWSLSSSSLLESYLTNLTPNFQPDLKTGDSVTAWMSRHVVIFRISVLDAWLRAERYFLGCAPLNGRLWSASR